MALSIYLVDKISAFIHKINSRYNSFLGIRIWGRAVLAARPGHVEVALVILSAIVICLGASAGALSRWFFNILLNPLFPAIPPGTLAVNWLGSFLMGVALSIIAMFPGLGQYGRLFFITGFLGSFTTFSAFSGEMAALLGQGRFMFCAGAVGLHVCGSIGLVFVGLWLGDSLKKIFS